MLHRAYAFKRLPLPAQIDRCDRWLHSCQGVLNSALLERRNGARSHNRSVRSEFSIALASTSAWRAAIAPITMSPLHRWCSSVESLPRPGWALEKPGAGDAPGLIQTRCEGCGRSSEVNPLLATPGALKPRHAARVAHGWRNRHLGAALGDAP